MSTTMKRVLPYKRTHTCGALRAHDIGRETILMGWVDTWRNHGGILFLDLRDRYGKTQIVFRPELADMHATAETLRSEFVI
ncbi:MAG: OB-fold nucleic acid binding domain-containing protein, partial [candidate division KSB1 bacterium]